jgi:hypothetical protein
MAAVPPRPLARARLTRLAAFAVLAVAIVNLGLGAWLYVTGSQEDLRLRWLEKSYVLRGVNPLDALSDQAPAQLGLPALGTMAGYAPWSYVYAMLFAPSADPDLAALAFGLLNLAALAVLAAYGRHSMRGVAAERALGWLAAAAAVCFVAIPVVLRHGNYGLVVTALIAGMLWLLERERPWLAGLCLGLAMIKPQLAALFAFVPLVRASWPTLLVAGACVGGAWLLAANLTDAEPLGLLTGMVGHAAGFGDAYQGVFAVLRDAGLPGTATTLLGMACGAAATGWLCWRNRDLDLLTLAAVPAVMATAWTYHRTHDLMILAFLGLAGLRLLATGAGPPLRRGGWLLLAAWTPYLNRMNEGYLLPTAFRLLWIAALWRVLASARAAADARRGGARSAGARDPGDQRVAVAQRLADDHRPPPLALRQALRELDP